MEWSNLSLVLWLALAACSPAPTASPLPSEPTPPRDDWPRSAIWRHATADAEIGTEPECRHVYRMLQREAECHGHSCRHPAALAKEWLEHCAPPAPADEAQVEALLTQLVAAEAPPSKCDKQLERYLEHGCAPAFCRVDAQEWATRCAEAVGSPLAVEMLEHVAARHMAATTKPLKLDPRSCTTLARAVRDAAWCSSETDCKKAWRVAGIERRRCGDAHPVAIGSAAQRAAIAAGAVRDPAPTPIREAPATIGDDEVPLVLADGRGAVLMACNHRVTELGAYLDARAACAGSFVHLARAVGHGSQRRLMRANLRISAAWELVDVLPMLAVRGERARLSARHQDAFVSELSAAVAKRDVGGLVTAIANHGRWLGQHQLRGLLHQRDSELVPLFERVARVKLAAQQLPNVGVQRQVAFRAAHRPFADVDAKGALHVGGDTAARWLVVADALPLAMTAYTAILEPLLQAGRRRTPTPRELATAATLSASAAQRCAQAREKRMTTEDELLACVLEACDEGHFDELVIAHGDAQRAAELQRREADDALSGAQTAGWLDVLTEHGCEAPLPD